MLRCDTCGEEVSEVSRIVADAGYDASLKEPKYNCPSCFNEKNLRREYVELTNKVNKLDSFGDGLGLFPYSRIRSLEDLANLTARIVEMYEEIRREDFKHLILTEEEVDKLALRVLAYSFSQGLENVQDRRSVQNRRLYEELNAKYQQEQMQQQQQAPSTS